MTRWNAHDVVVCLSVCRLAEFVIVGRHGTKVLLRADTYRQRQRARCRFAPLPLTLCGRIKIAELRWLIHWPLMVGVLYIWYSEKGPGRAAAPPSPLLAVPNVTAHPSTASVPMSYHSMWHWLLHSTGLTKAKQLTKQWTDVVAPRRGEHQASSRDHRSHSHFIPPSRINISCELPCEIRSQKLWTIPKWKAHASILIFLDMVLECTGIRRTDSRTDSRTAMLSCVKHN